MYNYFMTCNCYEPMFREEFSVYAEDINEAWDKAKTEASHKYDVNVENIAITSTRREDLGLTLYNSVKSLYKDKEVKKLIDAGADVNYRFKPDEFDYRPIHMASYYADIKKIELLVEAGCDINPIDISGRTPLDLAIVRHNRSNVIEYLVSHGAKHGVDLGKSVDSILKDASDRSIMTDNGATEKNEFVKE